MKRLFILFIFISSILATGVAAEFWACFNYQERINYCDYGKADETCDNHNGCAMCMSVYDEVEECFYHGVWPKCNQLNPNDCQTFGGGTIDTQPPSITFSSPKLDGTSLFTSTRVPFIFSLDERAAVYYYDNIHGRGRWTRVCTSCTSYDRSRSFKEGFNDLTIRAVDVVGNEGTLDLEFFVDSKKPRVYKTLPRRGFADGNFYIEYSEVNPVELLIHWKEEGSTGYPLTQVIPLGDCVPVRTTKMGCTTAINVDLFHGKEIEYWVTLTDIVGNVGTSRHYDLEVDIVAPVINEFNHEQDGRRMYFTFNITEDNFDEIKYMDNTDTRPRWRRLCSRLRDGICKTRKSFSTGQHDLDIKVLDDAGNYVETSLAFDV